MRNSCFRFILAAIALLTALFSSGCAMLVEMANTPADGSSYNSGPTPPSDPYYRGHSSDASAPGIK